MTKQTLIDNVASETGVSKKDVDAVIKALTGTITNAMKNGDSVQLKDFGTFKTSSRAARTGRNPQSGDPIQIPARNVAAFKAATALKNSLN